MSVKRTNNYTGFIVIGAIVLVAAGALYMLVGGGGASQIAYGDVDVSQAQEIIKTNQSNSEFVVLDVRTPQEVDAGVVEYQNANFEVIDFYDSQFNDQIAQLDKDKTYLIYCRSGNRSGQTYDRMVELGFTNIYNVEGGINAWEAAGLSMQRVE